MQQKGSDQQDELQYEPTILRQSFSESVIEN